MLVYFFSSLAIRAVGTTAQAIIFEVRRQFREMPGIMDYTQRPDYARVVDITTPAALSQMVLPGAIAVATPIVVGMLLGAEAIAGFLMVGTIAGVLLATVSTTAAGRGTTPRSTSSRATSRTTTAMSSARERLPTPRRLSATRSATRSRTPPGRRYTSW